MPLAKGIEINYKNANGNVPLHPQTSIEQVLNWGAGETYGPFRINIPANSWDKATKQATFDLAEITSNDIPYCNKILTGTKDQKIAQDKAYSLIDPLIGVESLDGQVRFTCTKEVPTVDITVQIEWER